MTDLINVNADQNALKALLSTANKLFNTKATTWDGLVDAILPPKINTARRLGAMYEQQMLLAFEAKAYFAACVMSASMLEAFLLLLCMLNAEKVATTKRYKDRVGKSVDDFDGIVCRLGLKIL